MLDKSRNRNWDRSTCIPEDDSVLATVVRTLRIIKQRWKIPIWFLLSFWLIGALYYSFSPRHYRSHAELLIHNVGRDELLVGSEQVLDEVVEKLSSLESEIFSGVSPERRVAFIREKISMTHPGGRPNVLSISFPHEDPRLAQFILSEIVETFKKYADDEKLRRSIDPKSVRKNEFAKRLLSVLQQWKAQLDSEFAAKRMELFISYKKWLKDFGPKIIQASGLDQLPKSILDSEKNSEPLRFASDAEKKIVRAQMRDPDIQKKIIDLKYLNYETKRIGQLTEMITDLVTMTKQEFDGQSPVLILSKPNEPVIPERPFSLELLFLLTTACGLVFGFGFVFLADRLDDRFRSTTEAERLLQIPFLGAIAFADRRNDRKTENPSSIGPTEDVQKAAALIRSRGRTFRSFAMASANARCQSPAAAMQLARAFADQDEKILLIDADLRSSELSQLCGQAERTGLGELLEKDIATDETKSTFASVVSWNGNLSFLPAGKFSGDLVSRLSRSQTKRLLTLFEKEFDRIILFAADLSTAVDAAILAGHVDGCLLSFDPNSKRTQVFEALRTLQKFGIDKIYGMTVRSGCQRNVSLLATQPAENAVENSNGPKLHIEETYSEERRVA